MQPGFRPYPQQQQQPPPPQQQRPPHQAGGGGGGAQRRGGIGMYSSTSRTVRPVHRHVGIVVHSSHLLPSRRRAVVPHSNSPVRRSSSHSSTAFVVVP